MRDAVNRRTPPAVVVGELAWHPAVQAWHTFDGQTGDPERIEILRKGKKAATFRLVGVGPAGESVIARRSPAVKAALERTIYHQVLPRLRLTAPRYYGTQSDGDGTAWVFLEDVGDERITLSDPNHLALAGSWVGTLHAGAAELPMLSDLPDGGPSRYRDHLRFARQTLRANLANPALAPADVDALVRLLDDLDAIDARWDDIEAVCRGMPATLVHGDIQRKNLHVRRSDGGLELFLVDWETAGWGVPAADLPKLDLESYRSSALANWPDLNVAALRRLAAAGEVFVQLAGIRSVSPETAHDNAVSLTRPLSRLRVLHERLQAAIQRLGAVT
jgi:thiamine kinase-like enzyme